MKTTSNIGKIRSIGNLDEALKLSQQLRQTVLKTSAKLADFHDRVAQLKEMEDRAASIVNTSDNNRRSDG